MTTLSHSWRPLLAVASLSLLAACSSQSMQQSRADSPSSPTPTATYEAPASYVVTGPTGMTLYTSDRDTPGRSNCNGECTQYWHPLIANQDSSANSNMTVIRRDDGQRQWATANGLPLYTYVDDRTPGEVNGNNIQNTWHVVKQAEATSWSGAPTTTYLAPASDVMTGPTGLTLYTYDRDAAGRSNCNDECSQRWHPLIANQDSSPTANMTLITRDDGQRQWATANGSPLYTYVQDRVPGDVNGNNIQNSWHVVRLSQAATWSSAPATMTQTSAGGVMTTPAGMTLYVYDRDTAGRSNCTGECSQYWQPLIANQDSSPNSTMTVIRRDDGQRQWATADGSPLYTFVQDRAPGDVNGNNFQNEWHVIRQSQPAPWSGAPATMTQTSAGNVLTTPEGMTLYTSDGDTAGRSNCVGDCIQYWHPLIANQDSSPTGNMTLITRDDGQRQWATANGSPLYTFVQDRAPGDVNGNNFHNTWHVVM